MSSSISSSRPLTAAEIARRRATPAPVPAPSSPSTTSTATAQAAAGAQAVQQPAEPFNAPPLQLPDNPSTRDVRTALVAAMADPTVNASTAQQLFQLHEQLMNAERSMIQSILDGVVS